MVLSFHKVQIHYLMNKTKQAGRDIFCLYSSLYDAFNVTFLHKGPELIYFI